MKLPPCVTIHSLAQARAALAAGLPVTLLSAPGAALYAGAGWWLALMEAAAGSNTPPNILDCATAPGRALEAARAGVKCLVLHAGEAALADTAAIARGYGARILTAAPPTLDLGQPGAERLLAAWLSSGGQAAETGQVPQTGRAIAPDPLCPDPRAP